MLCCKMLTKVYCTIPLISACMNAVGSASRSFVAHHIDPGYIAALSFLVRLGRTS